MLTSHPERRTPTFRQFAMVMAAVTWLAVVLPVGARAAGQLVTLTDPVTDGKARVVASGALRVAEYNDPARLPYRDSDSRTLSPATILESGVFTEVPDGYRLVIETVSVGVRVPKGEQAYNVRLISPSLLIPMSFVGGSSANNYYAGTEDVTLYVDPGDSPQWTMSRYPYTGYASVDFSVYGHLVKL
jgi:hypothetical protein